MIFESIETALKANTILFAAIHLGVVTVCLALFLYLTRARKKPAKVAKDDKTFTDEIEGKSHFRPAKASKDSPSAPENESGITTPSKPPAPPPPGVHLQRAAPIRLEVIHEPPATTGASASESVQGPTIQSPDSPKDDSTPEASGNGTIRFPEGMPPVVSTGSDPVAHRTKEEVAIRIYQLFQGKDSETLIAIDREEHILALNPGAEKLFQYLSHELRGKKIEDIIFLEAGDKEAAKGAGTDPLDEEDKQRAKGHAKDGSSFPVGVELEMADRPLGVILVRIHTLDLLVKSGKPVFEDLPPEEPKPQVDIASKVIAITASTVVLHPIVGDSKPVGETIDLASDATTPEPDASPESKPEGEAAEPAKEAAIVESEAVVEQEAPLETPVPVDSTATEAGEDKPVPEVVAAIEETIGEDDSTDKEPTGDNEPDVAEPTVIEEAVSAEPAIVPVEDTGLTPDPQAADAPAEAITGDLTPPSDTPAEEASVEQPKDTTEEPAAPVTEPLSISEATTPEPDAIPESKPEGEDAEPAKEAAIVESEAVVEQEAPLETPVPVDFTATEAGEDNPVPEVVAAIEETTGEVDSTDKKPTGDKEPDVAEPTVIEEAVSTEPAIVPVEETGLTPDPQAADAHAEAITDDLTPPSDTSAEEASVDQPKDTTEEPAAPVTEPLPISEATTPEPDAIPASKPEAEDAGPAKEAAIVESEPVVDQEAPLETPVPVDSTATEAGEDNPVPEVVAAIEETTGEVDSTDKEPTGDKEPDVAEPTVIEEAVSAEPAIVPVEETGLTPDPQAADAHAEAITDDLTPPSDTSAEEASVDQPKDTTEEPAAPVTEPLPISEATTPEPDAIPASKPKGEDAEPAKEAAIVESEPVVEQEAPLETPVPEMSRESFQTPESMPSLGEIEQPLHSISRIAKLMAVEQPDAQRIKEYAEAIEERSNRMAEQIEELKSMLKQARSQGASSSKMTPIDISRLADILANEASSLVSSSDKRVQCNILDADALYGLGNESGLTQVINSLIDLGLHCIGSGCVHIDVRSDATEPLDSNSDSYNLNGKTLVPDTKREVIIQTRFQTSPAIRQYLESAFGPNPDFDAIEDDPSIAILAGIASRIRLSVRAMNGRFVFETPVADEVMVQTQWDMQCLREEL